MYKPIILAAVVMTAVPTVASAEPTDTIVIDASGRQTVAGARRFRAALTDALDRVCGSYGSSEQNDWPAIGTCRRSALQNVNSQLAARSSRVAVRLARR